MKIPDDATLAGIAGKGFLLVVERGTRELADGVFHCSKAEFAELFPLLGKRAVFEGTLYDGTEKRDVRQTVLLRGVYDPSADPVVIMLSS